MKPYGSKRSFDTEPRIKSGRALVKREGEAEIEATAQENRPRCACGAYATWFYEPAGRVADYCDTCVPRGCSCQDDPNVPCVEYDEYETDAC